VSTRIQIRMGGYGPPDTGFSRALKRIGDRLEAAFADEVEVKYVWNVMDLGYRAEDILWLVEHGLLTLGYQSSSYLVDRVPELGIVDLPFLFADNRAARAAMDGELGSLLAQAIEARTNYRILGYFENGFRHLSNRLRPVRAPQDLAGMTIRVLPSHVHARTFELLGAVPRRMDLTEALSAVVSGTIDAQENPLANTVTYGVHKHHRFHTLTGHFYLSRPIFLHRPSYEGWPERLRSAVADAVGEAVAWQRGEALKEQDEARSAIERAEGEVIALDAAGQAAFIAATAPLYDEARALHGDALMARIGR
jgi:TRAP-type transport system periplasmic protein